MRKLQGRKFEQSYESIRLHCKTQGYVSANQSTATRRMDDPTTTFHRRGRPNAL
jgi:hypothetical protein